MRMAAERTFVLSAHSPRHAAWPSGLLAVVRGRLLWVVRGYGRVKSSGVVYEVDPSSGVSVRR
jgi:hypothetical protein